MKSLCDAILPTKAEKKAVGKGCGNSPTGFIFAIIGTLFWRQNNVLAIDERKNGGVWKNAGIKLAPSKKMLIYSKNERKKKREALCSVVGAPLLP